MSGSNDTSREQNAGGETHQVRTDENECLTTNQGVKISDNQNQLKGWSRGPVLLEDFVLREKIFHFDHERIPERIVHARGSAAHGYFECYEDLSALTKADLFSEGGKRTPVFARFSTVAGGAGSVDTPRDVRGFAVKFYTQAGNWDLVGNNIPVFFIQDAIKFPDLIHAAKMEAQAGYPQAATAHDTFWDFVSLMPEASHMIMWAMSDRTLPRSLRTMQGFGIHTFRMVNAEGESTFVKFHWKPRQGLASTIWDETVKIAGADPDFHRRDLFEAIERGAFPEWELGIQSFDQEFAESLPFDVLDATKLIPEEIVPIRPVGRMVLDRNPDNFFAETEQVAFCPANIVPGIDFSDDPLLQGRLFSYLDTQLKRLGSTNFHQLPINAPKCPVTNFQRDGHMQMSIPKGRANYEPNSLYEIGEDGGPRECPKTGFVSFPHAERQGGDAVKIRLRPESFADHYSQARLFFRSLSVHEQNHVVAALIFELSKVGLEHVRVRMVANLGNVDPVLAKRVSAGMAMECPPASQTAAPVQDFDLSPALRLIDGPHDHDTLQGRSFGILVGDGTDASSLMTLCEEIEKGGGRPVIVAPKIGGVTLSDGAKLAADGQLAGMPSVLFDAVALVLDDEACRLLVEDAPAVQFVMDAFGHLKAIGHNDGAGDLLAKAGVVPGPGIVALEDFAASAGRRYWDREAIVRHLT